MPTVPTVPTPRVRRLAVVVAVAAVLGSAAACGGDDGDDGAAPGDGSTTEVEAVETTTTTEADATTTTTTTTEVVDPDDDTDGDGEIDPFCDEADFGGGLVLQVHCDLEGLTGEVPEGVTLVPGSLFGLRTTIHRSLDGISGNLVVSRAPDASRVFVLVFQSDALFESGSAELVAVDTFDGVIGLIARDFAGSAVQVRGHTDSVGDAAANQQLSDARAEAVRSHLVAGGVEAGEVTTVGFGEDQPLALDDTEAGRAFNRRVEVVIRPPTG